MAFKPLFSLLLVTFAALLSFSVSAKELSLTSKGVVITAKLEMAAGQTINDPIVVLTHGTLAHNKMEIIAQLQSLFKENGISTLAVNLGLGISNRQGMYDCATTHRHLHTDAVDEIGLWVDWLKQQGAKQLVLLGHSRGGNQTAWYAAEHNDSVIKKVILLAPALWSEDYAAKEYLSRYQVPLKSVLDKAQALVKSGQAETVMQDTGHIYCPNTTVTAASFVSYYKPDTRFNTVALLPKIKAPVLVFAGSEDTVVKDIEVHVAPLVKKGKIDLSVIDGAGHMFRDLYAEDVMDQIVNYMGQ